MSADPLLLRAIEAHRGGRLAEAEAGYRRVLRERPRDADALNFLGMLRFHRGDAVEASRLLHESVEVMPGNANAWINLGNVLLSHGDADASRSAFTRATELAPDMAIAWFNLGVCLRRFKAPQEAASCFHKALQLQPGYAAAYDALGLALYRLGDLVKAAEVYGEWLAHHPGDPVATHMLAAVTGENAPERAGDAFVVATFERFAERFDENLSELGYRAPQLLAGKLAAIVGAAADLEILDAGCGTGLCAPLVRPMARRLTGVDLSPAMIEKARVRGGYDELVEDELSAFMRSRPRSFDVVLSADTLCYFGALEEPVAAVKDCLRAGGVVAFTVERLESGGARFRIEPHGRYSHTESYVAQVLAEAGFTDVTVGHDTLRRERGADVSGLVVSARRGRRRRSLRMSSE